MATVSNIDRLKSQLATANVRETDVALFQVVNQLIGTIKLIQESLNKDITTVNNSIPPNLVNLDFLTSTNESVNLPDSRQLVAGTNITFSDTVANIRTVNASGTTTPTYITQNNEIATLPNSRRLLAGFGITFNTSEAGTFGIAANAVVNYNWGVLTDGDDIEPELIYTNDGDVVMTKVLT